MFQIYLKGILGKKVDDWDGEGPIITSIEEGPGLLRVFWEYIPSKPTFSHTKTQTSITYTVTDVHDGHSPITEWQYNIGAGWVTIGTQTTYEISGLSTNETYPLRIRAVNARGTGITSDTINIELTDEPESNWILATGQWNDSGVWEDDSFWND